MKPTYKKWMKIGALLTVTPLLILIHLFIAAKDGQRPEIYNYVPVWSGAFLLPTYILGMIFLAVGIAER